MGVPAGEVPSELGTSLTGTLIQVGLGQPRFSLICCKVMGVNRQPGGSLGAIPDSAFSLSMKMFVIHTLKRLGTYFEETIKSKESLLSASQGLTRRVPALGVRAGQRSKSDLP